MTELGRTYSLRVEVLSPIHIGCGRMLKRDLDYVVQRGRTYRLNEQAVFDEYWPEDLSKQNQMLGLKPADMLGNVDLAKSDRLVLYSYEGVPAMGEVNEHIKDVYGRAYIPGSSLKGALRTLLMRTMIEGVKQQALTRADIGDPPREAGRPDRAAKAAAEKLERRYAGPDPNHSLFRGLHVSDTSAVEPAQLRLRRIQMRPELDIDVEAIAIGTTLDATLRIDRYTLLTLGETLGFEPTLARTVVAFGRAANFTAATRVERELQYHFARNESQAANFYGALRSMLKEPDFDKRAFLLQVGFATGWAAKTLLGGVPVENPLIAQVVNEFELNKGGKRGRSRDEVAEMQPGDAFPKARHLAHVNGAPALPMGWLKVSFQ